MEERSLREDTGRVIAVAVALWACVVGIATVEGAFTRFEESSLATFAALISLYALAVYRFDPHVRAYALGLGAAPVHAFAAASAGALAASLAMGSAPLWMLFSPLAALAVAAMIGAWRQKCRAATSGSSAKSPGATPAAT